MLKIKDTVDLKELEKYGFYRKYDYFVEKIDVFKIAQVLGFLVVNTETREISTFKKVFKEDATFINDDVYNIPTIDTLYDLIKDGLVEKAED